LVIIGTVVLTSILSLSSEFVGEASQNKEIFESLGKILKVTRDSINHGFMVFALSTANILFYLILIKVRLIPVWLSIWGIIGAVLSAIGSVLLLYQVLDVITTEYILLNIPTVLAELLLGFWLVFKGFKKVQLK
jgi:hypothetical protein